MLAFAEKPKFTSGSNFGNVLERMYLSSQMDKGLITEDSLTESFEALSPRERLILETLPIQAPDDI